jgi:hypothetical protein
LTFSQTETFDERVGVSSIYSLLEVAIIYTKFTMHTNDIAHTQSSRKNRAENLNTPPTNMYLQAHIVIIPISTTSPPTPIWHLSIQSQRELEDDHVTLTEGNFFSNHRTDAFRTKYGSSSAMCII